MQTPLTSPWWCDLTSVPRWLPYFSNFDKHLPSHQCMVAMCPDKTWRESMLLLRRSQVVSHWSHAIDPLALILCDCLVEFDIATLPAWNLLLGVLQDAILTGFSSFIYSRHCTETADSKMKRSRWIFFFLPKWSQKYIALINLPTKEWTAYSNYSNEFISGGNWCY